MIRYCTNLIFTLLAALTGTAAAEPQPKAFFPQTVYDFGTVPQGTAVERDFEIENRGAGPLHIRKIHAACGCTAAVLQSDTIEPNSKTTIKVKLDTSGFQGYKIKTVRVYTNDPDNASTVITLKGAIKTEVDIQPATVNFGNVAKGQPQSMEVSVTSTDPAFKIVSITPRSDQIEVTAQDLPNGKKLRIALKPTLPVGAVRSRVALKTNSSRTPVLNIPVVAGVRGDLVLSEAAVSFGLVEAPLTANLTKEVMLSNHSTNLIKILSARSDHPNLQADVEEIEPGKQFRLTVRVSEHGTGAFRGRLYIETDHPDPDQKEISIPVYAIISRESARS